MPLSVVIAPDKFKGTLTARQAAEAIARGWRAARPNDSLDLLPMSDGGDGFGEILSRLLGATEVISPTFDAAHRPCRSTWWWHKARRTAIIESARIIGLAMLPPRRFHPFQLDTAGLADVLRQAASHGAQRILLGIGGSATNDGGHGLATALGWQFLDPEKRPILRWTELNRLDCILAPNRSRLFDELTVAVDVRNPLLGREGCTRIYGPQKGLCPKDFPIAEACLGRLAEIAHRQFRRDFAVEPGAGAAGGLGFGLRCFGSARLEPGFGLFARLSSLPARVRASQLAITGEGAIDHSTLMGKGVGEFARLCRELAVPCLGLGGVVPDIDMARQAFAAVHALAPGLTTRQEAMSRPAYWLERLAATVARRFEAPSGS